MLGNVKNFAFQKCELDVFGFVIILELHIELPVWFFNSLQESLYYQQLRSHSLIPMDPKFVFLLIWSCVSWPFSVLWPQRTVFWSLRLHVTSLNHSLPMIGQLDVRHEELLQLQALSKVVLCFNEYSVIHWWINFFFCLYHVQSHYGHTVLTVEFHRSVNVSLHKHDAHEVSYIGSS